MNIQNPKFLEQVEQAVREAGQIFYDRTKASHMKHKGVTDFVTEVDLSVQTFLKERLAQLAPEVQLMGEEKDNSDLDFEKPMWILDPVDGTMNLVHGFRHSAVSLALADKGQVELGLVYDPYAGELFSARRGGGAFVNGEPIHVSGAKRLADCLVDVGTNPSQREAADRTFRCLRAVYDRCHDIRRVGAASVDLCYVAAGRLDAYVENSLKPWDYAAGLLIVQEAGGAVVTVDGAAPSLKMGGDVMGTNGAVTEELLAVLRQAANG